MLQTLHSALLLSMGVWLLFYRLALRTPLRPQAELLTTALTGMSLSILAPLPLVPYAPEGPSAVILGLLGLLLSCVHSSMTALVACLIAGLSLGAGLWQVKLCEMLPGSLWIFGVHGLVLNFVTLLFLMVFWCFPGVAGPTSFTVVVVPLLGSLLVALGLAGLVPDLQGLSPHGFFAAVPCSAGAEGLPAARSAGLMLALFAVGVVFQLLLSRISSGGAQKKRRPGGDMLTSLLPEAGEEDGPPSGVARKPDPDNRFQIIVRAIYAEDGADQSHLSEHEKALVEVCRNDEFERDRVVWGGGLI